MNLATLIIVVRRHGFASLMTTMALILLIVVWSIRGNIAEWIFQNPTPSQQHERITRAIGSDKKISDALENERDQLNADRIHIRQFHNLDDPNSSIPVPTVTFTYSEEAPGITPPSYISIPRAMLGDVMDPMWRNSLHPQCVVLTPDQVKNSTHRTRLVDDGVVIIFNCPIVDLSGAPIGIIGVTYLSLDKPRPENDVIFARLQASAVKVAGYLAEVTQPEKPWYEKFLLS